MRGLALTVLLGVLVVGAGAVGAADWGGVIPGESTKEIVRARHGDPTRATTQKVDRFDSAQWVYEGDQAPTGMFRMTVDFGLAGPAGDRKSTRLNSSHVSISYAVFCLKKKKKQS